MTAQRSALENSTLSTDMVESSSKISAMLLQTGILQQERTFFPATIIK